MAYPIIDKICQVVKLTPETIDRLQQIIQERHFRRGDTIEVSNSFLKNAFYMVRGMAMVYYIENGREHTYSFAMEDEFIVLSAVLAQQPDTPMVIEFLETSTMLFMPHHTIHRTIEEMQPELSQEVVPFILTALFNHINYLDERMLMLQNTSARTRYEWLVKRYPRLLERAPVTKIASFLGVTRETLYRIRSNKYTGR